MRFYGFISGMERNWIRERTLEGRLAKGEAGKGGRPKAITEEQKKAFRRDVKKNYSIAKLAQKYNVSNSTAYRLRKEAKAT